jgi:hypothetical protein
MSELRISSSIFITNGYSRYKSRITYCRDNLVNVMTNLANAMTRLANIVANLVKCGRPR